jgi:putative flavoprotein involved in K+ transport
MLETTPFSSLFDEGAALEAEARTDSGRPLDVIVVGGGQAGLSTGYHLKRLGLRFVILDGSERVGDVWRKRWDTLRLFTPAWLDSLDGLPFPAPRDHFPTKDEMADYLELYARHFALPVRSGVRVDALRPVDGGYELETSRGTYRAPQVVVALSSFQRRRLPAFARELDASIRQVHTLDYKSPADLQEGPVLIVGAGNSGAEVGMDVASRGHAVTLAGRSVGVVPFRVDGFLGKLFIVRLVLRVLFHRILTIHTPMGRKMRPIAQTKGHPLIRQKPRDLALAGIVRAPRLVGVRSGKPLLEDGRVLAVTNVVWATGFDGGLDFVKLPIFDERHEVIHDGGVVRDQPGLYFVGQNFLYAFSSTMIHGVGRDAARIAEAAKRQARLKAFAPRAA